MAIVYMRNAYLLGAGLTTAMGTGVSSNIKDMQSQHRPVIVDFTLQEESFSLPYFAIDPPNKYRFNSDDLLATYISEQRTTRIIEQTVQEALLQADISAEQQKKMGLFIGSSSLTIGLSDAIYQQDLRNASTQLTNEQPIPLQSPSDSYLSYFIKKTFCIEGQDHIFTTACTSSSNALLYATAMLKEGWIEHALVVGVELFNMATLSGFSALQLTCNGTVMQPFMPDKSGMILGEGCGAVVFGSDCRETSSGNLFYIAGGSNLGDNYGVTAANPDGGSIQRVMIEALRQANISSSDITAIKAHGTGNPMNDNAEISGVKSFFSPIPPVCILKPYIGHTLGACGVIELILFCRYLEENGELINSCRDYDVTPHLPLTSGEKVTSGCFILNYFGFGGNNTSLIISNRS